MHQFNFVDSRFQFEMHLRYERSIIDSKNIVGFRFEKKFWNKRKMTVRLMLFKLNNICRRLIETFEKNVRGTQKEIPRKKKTFRKLKFCSITDNKKYWASINAKWTQIVVWRANVRPRSVTTALGIDTQTTKTG